MPKKRAEVLSLNGYRRSPSPFSEAEISEIRARLLALTGNLRDDNNPISVLWNKGFRRFPGRPVKEVLAQPENQKAAITGATKSP